MDYQTWIEGINGLASLFAFDILPDGSFSEIRLMAVNKMNVGMLAMNPNAPEFYPGIPYRNYWMDLNFESFLYKCGSTSQPLYSYVNARGVWLKGFYIPIADIWDEAGKENAESENAGKTVYCMYIITYSAEVDTDSIARKSSDVANAVMEISIKLHETHDFYNAMASTAKDIRAFCGAERCSLYTMDKSNRKCDFINEEGLQNEYLKTFAAGMGRTPFEVAESWERDLALSDCLILDDLTVIKERDPQWYESLVVNDIRNIILYAIRYNQMLVGFIWAANYDTSKKDKIKETLELSTFIIAAVIANHQLVSRLEIKSTVDALTQVGNRNAMKDLIERYSSGSEKLPEEMGIAYADLNGLKAMNDTNGHEAGDRLLVRAASLLKLAFDGYDIFRIGGDEFVVLCNGIKKEELDLRISRLRGLSENTGDVSFAIGSEHCVGEYDLNSAIQTADGRMYKDKVEFYKNHPERNQRK